MSGSSKLPIQLLIGPHRSGTSITTQILSVMGLDLGRSLMRPSHDNPSGFWENEKIVQIHDTLLRALGKDWTTAAFLPDDWVKSPAAKHAIADLKVILDEDFAREKVSLIKDPRLCLLLPLWERLAKELKRPLHTMGIIRFPGDVTASIQNRNFMSKAKSEIVVGTHYQGMQKSLTRHKPAVLVYENLAELPAKSIAQQLSKALPHLDLQAEDNTVNLIGRLIYKKPNSAPVTKARKKYAGLTQTGRLWMSWDEAKSFFTPYKNFKTTIPTLEKIAAAKTLLPRDSGSIEIPKAKLKRLETRLEKMSRELEVEQARNLTFVSKFEAEKSRADALDGGVHERDETLLELHDTISRLQERVGAFEGGLKERDVKIKTLLAAETKDHEKLGALAGGIEERDIRIKDILNELTKSKEEVGALEGGLKERDTKIKTLLADQTKEQEKLGALEGGLEERDSKIADLLKTLTKTKEKLGALEGGIEERDTKIKELLSTHTQDQERLGALEGGIKERDTAIQKLHAAETEYKEKIGALAGGIEERDATIKEANSLQGRNLTKIDKLEAELKKRVSEIDKLMPLKDQIKERDAVLADLKKARKLDESRTTSLESENLERNKLIKDLRAKHASQLEKVSTIDSTLKKRAASIRGLKSSATKMRKRIEGLQTNLSERDTAISDLQEEQASQAEQLGALKGGITERDEMIRALRKDVRERNDALEELQRIKDMQDVTIEMEGVRSKMVEKQLSQQVVDAETQLIYYKKNPVKAGVKRATFKTLSTLRHGIPLPESVKLSTARKLTGLAQSLQPPAQHLHIDATPEPLSASTTVNFAFKETDKPVISIIIPVYNEISQTIACLKSVYQQQCEVDYEVIIADDASPDPFHKVLKEIEGLRYFRNEKNLHFLRNCNENAKHARGDFLVFLNNDTLVKPGWLQNLYRTFFEHGDVGIVGSKLVFPSGELQEAGGIIWEDASGWNWGRGQDPEHPRYNYVRDADYVSGASLMIPTRLWKELGGFDEAYEKAYYEDTDICFKVRSMGYRVLYQPSSVVIHIEGLSSGTDINQGAKKYQKVNEAIFKERWKDILAHHLPNAQTPHIASDRNVRGHVLYIDAVTPEPQKDSGSLDAVYAMRILTGLGYRVHFIPGSNFAYWGEATQDLQKQGIECIYHPHYSNIDAVLKDRGDMFDFAMVSRAESADLFLSKIKKKCPSAKIIYNTVDLHFLRMQRRAEITNDPDVLEAANAMKAKELSFIKKSDATIILSEVEYKLLSKQKSLKDKLWVVPLIRAESERLVTYDKTKDIVFIGGYSHPPNIDAVDWLVEKIWPEIKPNVPDAKLIICGSNMPERFNDFASDDVLIKGYVPDLNALLSRTRLTIAPLRFGAGLKGKVASSIGAGVPCVGTQVAFEGMAEKGLADIKFLAETPEDFAVQIGRIYNDKDSWKVASLAGVSYHNNNYAFTNVAKTFSAILESLE